ncbi:hypothetical protein SADUNF_Sadunf07G0098700 [Salix dunnii]|uniref:J domain-containing protein n=1 Tax=Salix dunnii TaxID=1413687 RepID=A0A835MVM9_9ROSI|nr:hypothetical protein SADUNF_Sadunf07G0098700 [Salix dunnii]
MDGSSSGGGNGYRVEAERWLSISEKLLAARDLQGAKSFATRSRESDPRLYRFADQIIAVADTLLAGDLCVENNNYYDYYTILQLGRFTPDLELIANQYRKLALLLNPTSNRLLFADQAFKLVSEAWLILSNPAKKAMYDHELQLSQLGLLVTQQLPTPPFQEQPQSAPEPIRPVPLFTTARMPDSMPESSILFPAQPKPVESPRPQTQQRNHPEPAWRQPQQMPTKPTKQSTPRKKPTELTQQPTLLKTATEPPKQSTPSKTPKDPTWPEVVIGLARSAPKRSATDSTRRVTKPIVRKASESEPEVPSFWTACPYCYILYEYPKAYEECILRCQSCRRAFHAVMVPAPPLTGKDTCFCCWGFFPLGFSGNNEKGANGFDSNWSPFSAIFATPFQAGDAVDSGVIWERRQKNPKGKGTPNKKVKKLPNEILKDEGAWRGNIHNVDSDGRGSFPEEVVGKGEGIVGKKKAAKDLGKLDLNVMFGNETLMLVRARWSQVAVLKYSVQRSTEFYFLAPIKLFGEAYLDNIVKLVT